MTPLSVRRTSNTLTNLVLVGPATVAMLVLIFVPVLIVAVLSFTDYQFGASGFRWIGLGNYTDMLTDPIGRRALTNTLIYVAIVVPTATVFALLVAMGLYGLATRSSVLAGILRVSYFLPVAATLVAMAIVWQMLLHPSIGR